MSEEKTQRLARWDGQAISQINRQLELAQPHEIVAWAVEHFSGRLALSCSFGGDGGTMLAHMIAAYQPPVPILFLETGLLFAETLTFKRELSTTFGLHVIDVHPERSVEEQASTFGPRLWERDPNRCCLERKVKPMLNALSPFDAWMTGIRSSQTSQREHAPIVAFDEQYEVVKINPLVNASSAAIDDYLTRFELPHNPLKDQGYLSIGCWPCTSRVAPGEDPRAGRWRGADKTECGLHANAGQLSQEKNA